MVPGKNYQQAEMDIGWTPDKERFLNCLTLQIFRPISTSRGLALKGHPVSLLAVSRTYACESECAN